MMHIQITSSPCRNLMGAQAFRTVQDSIILTCILLFYPYFLSFTWRPRASPLPCFSHTRLIFRIQKDVFIRRLHCLQDTNYASRAERWLALFVASHEQGNERSAGTSAHLCSPFPIQRLWGNVRQAQYERGKGRASTLLVVLTSFSWGWRSAMSRLSLISSMF